MFYQLINIKTGKQVSFGLSYEIADYFCQQDKHLIMLPAAL